MGSKVDTRCRLLGFLRRGFPFVQAHSALVVVTYRGDATAHRFGNSDIVCHRALPQTTAAMRRKLRRITGEIAPIDLDFGEPVMAAGAFAANVGQHLPQKNRCRHEARQKPDGIPMRGVLIHGNWSGRTSKLTSGVCDVEGRWLLCRGGNQKLRGRMPEK
jgi:hypothetical protein